MWPPQYRQKRDHRRDGHRREFVMTSAAVGSPYKNNC